MKQHNQVIVNDGIFINGTGYRPGTNGYELAKAWQREFNRAEDMQARALRAEQELRNTNKEIRKASGAAEFAEAEVERLKQELAKRPERTTWQQDARDQGYELQIAALDSKLAAAFRKIDKIREILR